MLKVIDTRESDEYFIEKKTKRKEMEMCRTKILKIT